jgi:hypothetical protein
MTRLGADPEHDVVVTALNLVYHAHFANGRYRLAPLGHAQEYAWVPEVWTRMGWRDVDVLVAEGRVYVSDFAADDDEARAAYDALATRYRLEPVDDAARLARVHPRP